MNELTTPGLGILMGWSLIWVGAATIALWRSEGSGRWRAFWFMSGLWAVVNLAIVLYALFNPPTDVQALRRILLINAGLDVGYLAAAVWLMTRASPMLRGFGLAVFVQGLFLLVFDLVWWWWLGASGSLPA
ncbi:DUF6992 family protein [Mucisphaera sp.]|uniref:DUF6992 family protein n=1 Tax=Mucisphaera sp. TaxID=2913024 RepID=UPI003D0B33D8